MNTIIIGLIDMIYLISDFVSSLSAVKFTMSLFFRFYYDKKIEPSKDYTSESSLNLGTLKSSSLLVCKKNHFYVTRRIDETNTNNIWDPKNKNIFFEKFIEPNNLHCVYNNVVMSNVGFIYIQYNHPKLKNSLQINLSPKYFVVGNEILSDIFVCRYLVYEYGKHVLFEDMDYTLTIIDKNIKTKTMTRNQHMILDVDEYKIVDNNKYK